MTTKTDYKKRGMGRAAAQHQQIKELLPTERAEGIEGLLALGLERLVSIQDRTPEDEESGTEAEGDTR